jgi:hypothetical protein
VRDEAVAASVELSSRDPEITALLLQCSDLPPFAADIQKATGLPVFDMTGLLNWLHQGFNRVPFV